MLINIRGKRGKQGYTLLSEFNYLISVIFLLQKYTLTKILIFSP